MGYLRRPMQIRTTPMENFTNNIKGLFKTIPPVVTDFETTFVKAQIDLNKNLYPVNNVGDLICQANEAAQLSAAVIDRQIEFSKLSDELKGRSLLIHFISDLMGHDDPHELVFRRHAETSHIPPVGEYTLFSKTREMPWILTWAVSSSIIFLGDVFLIESASIWFVKVALTSLIGKNMNDIATKLDLHLSILLPKVIRRDNRMITARRNNFASISMKNINNINDKSNNNISDDSIKLSEYESDYEWKKKHVNACEILFVSNYIAKKENFRTLPESTFILEYRDPYPEKSGHFWNKASLDIDKSTHKVAVIVDHVMKQGLEWILMMLGLNFWGFFLSDNKNLNPVSLLSKNNYNRNMDEDDEDDDENDYFKARITKWDKTSLEEVLCGGFDRAQEKLQEEEKVVSSFERERWLDTILTKEERKKLAIMEKKRKRMRNKDDGNFTIFEYLFSGYVLAFAAVPLHVQHFFIEILLSLIFVVLWGVQQEMGTLGYMGGGIVIVLTTLIAPKLPGAFFWLLKKLLQLIYAPIKLAIIIISYPFKLIKRFFGSRSIHHHPQHSHLNHIEDEDKVNATGGKSNDNDYDDNATLTYQLNDDEQKVAKNRGEAFNNANKNGISIWQWVTLGSNPDFPQFKAKSKELARLRTVEDISLEEQKEQEEAKARAEAEVLNQQNEEIEDDDESLETDAYSSMTEITDLSSTDANEEDQEDEYYDWVANDKENNKFLVIQKERVKLERLILEAKRWRRYSKAVIEVGRIELARQKEDMKAYRWQQEKKKIKILVREAAKQRRIRQAFITASHERKREILIEKLKWKRIRVYFKAEAKRIFKVRVELMKKMRRVRQQFKLAAWEQRERYWMNDEEEYMNNFLEKESELNTNNDMIKEEEATHEFNKKELELENQTREAMSTNEIEMREFLAEELRLEQESEANTNDDMIEEEEYLRKTFEELDIMEENERKLMAYDEG